MRASFIAFCACFLAVLSARSEPELVNGIAVIVNDAVITEQDLQEFTAPAVELLARQHARDAQRFQQELVKLRTDAVEQLVNRELVLHDFKQAGYNLPESYIDDNIKTRIRERFGDRVTLTKTLQAQGITFEKFRAQVREQIIIEALTAKNISQELLISPHKIEKYYATNQEAYKMGDQVKLRMIVINQPATAPSGASRKIAEEIIAKLEEGASFAEMASVYSEGSQRAQGGDWGWVEKSVLRKELADVAFSLKAGQRSGIIETPSACYIMLVEEIRASHIRPLEEVRDDIEKTLLVQERERLRKQWMGRLKKKAFVRYF